MAHQLYLAELKYDIILAVGGRVLSYDFSKFRKTESQVFQPDRLDRYGCLYRCIVCFICRAAIKLNQI